MSVLELQHVKKTFGEKTVLNDVTFSLNKNRILGFVGVNGAGKTTTMKAILGLIKKDSGEISVMGESVTFGKTQTNRWIGFLPDVPEFYDYMNSREYLELCGEVTDLSKEKRGKKIPELLELVGLKEEKKKIRAFSRGMKQRLGMAQALLNEPKILICDEPTSALDPIGRKQILDILKKVKEQTTILFSTHILSDVEQICDEVAFLHQGNILLYENVEKLKEEHQSNDYSIIFKNEKDSQSFLEERDVLSKSFDISQEGQHFTLKATTPEDNGYAILQVLEKKQLVPLQFEKHLPTLESIFMEVTK